jgi:hypothetical protein
LYRAQGCAVLIATEWAILVSKAGQDEVVTQNGVGQTLGIERESGADTTTTPPALAGLCFNGLPDCSNPHIKPIRARMVNTMSAISVSAPRPSLLRSLSAKIRPSF